MRKILKVLCMLIVAMTLTGILPLLDVWLLGDKTLSNAPFIALICIAAFCLYLLLSGRSLRRYSLG